MITVSEESIARKRPRDKLEAEEWDKKWNARKGQIMSQKDRAKVLMDQKATSVADIAAALRIAKEREEVLKREEAENPDEDKPKKAPRKLSNKQRKRANEAKKHGKLLEKETLEKVAELENILSTNEVNAKIDLEGALGKVPEGQIQVKWVDLQDAHHATSWPDNVGHGVLEQTREHYFGSKLKGEVEQLVTESEPAPAPEQSTEAPPSEGSEGKKEDKSGVNRLKFW